MSKEQIFDALLGREGGYVDHPADKGGPTNWGITEKTARAHGYRGDMRNLTREQALVIYESDYWYGPYFDQVYAYSASIAEELLDTGVNMGPSVPAKWLQRWLTALNDSERLYPDIATDGVIGPRTLSALNLFLQARSKEGEAVLQRALNCSQGARYLELAEQRSQNESFLYGWLRERVA